MFQRKNISKKITEGSKLSLFMFPRNLLFSFFLIHSFFKKKGKISCYFFFSLRWMGKRLEMWKSVRSNSEWCLTRAYSSQFHSIRIKGNLFVFSLIFYFFLGKWFQHEWEFDWGREVKSRINRTMFGDLGKCGDLGNLMEFDNSQ
jgi:hypothetical protein